MIEQKFLAEWSCASAEEYYTSLMELAAPIQNLIGNLSADQLQRIKRRILEATSKHQRDNRIIFPIAVRFVAARKPIEGFDGITA